MSLWKKLIFFWAVFLGGVCFAAFFLVADFGISLFSFQEFLVVENFSAKISRCWFGRAGYDDMIMAIDLFCQALRSNLNLSVRNRG
jgi:hypothetical protein